MAGLEAWDFEAHGIHGLVVNGSEITVDISDRITEAAVDESNAELSQMTITLSDPFFKLLERNVFPKGAPLRYGDLDLAIAAIETGGSGPEMLTITARNRGVLALMQEHGSDPGGGIQDAVSYSDYLRQAAGRHGLKVLAQGGNPGGDAPQLITRSNQVGHFESTWDVLQRGATQLGFWLFESAGTIYFGKPSWLLASARTSIRVGWHSSAGSPDFDSLQIPKCRRFDVIGPDLRTEATTIEVSVSNALAALARPGTAMQFSGIAGFAGRYLIVHNTWKAGSHEPGVITASDIRDPIVNTGTPDLGYLPNGTALPVGPAPSVPYADHPGLLDQAVQAIQVWPFIASEAAAKGLPVELVLAVGSKETNLGASFANGATGDNGHGHGIWQLDDRSHQIPAGFDHDPQAQCRTACSMLRALIGSTNNDWLAALNMYNSGQTESANTTGGNYGDDVLSRYQFLLVNFNKALANIARSAH